MSIEPAGGRLADGGAAPGPWWKRLLWFVGLWAAGVVAVGSLAYLLRLWLKG